MTRIAGLGEIVSEHRLFLHTVRMQCAFPKGLGPCEDWEGEAWEAGGRLGRRKSVECCDSDPS